MILGAIAVDVASPVPVCQQIKKQNSVKNCKKINAKGGNDD
jgi:hypothetical protein